MLNMFPDNAVCVELRLTIRQQTRALAREQFLKKALEKKIARGMGLDEYGMR
jgi:hypothetical protein